MMVSDPLKRPEKLDIQQVASVLEFNEPNAPPSRRIRLSLDIRVLAGVRIVCQYTLTESDLFDWLHERPRTGLHMSGYQIHRSKVRFVVAWLERCGPTSAPHQAGHKTADERG